MGLGHHCSLGILQGPYLREFSPGLYRSLCLLRHVLSWSLALQQLWSWSISLRQLDLAHLGLPSPHRGWWPLPWTLQAWPRGLAADASHRPRLGQSRAKCPRWWQRKHNPWSMWRWMAEGSMAWASRGSLPWPDPRPAPMSPPPPLAPPPRAGPRPPRLLEPQGLPCIMPTSMGVASLPP